MRRTATSISSYATLNGHEPNGERCFITFNRKSVSPASVPDHATWTKQETCADTVPTLPAGCGPEGVGGTPL